MSKDGHEPSSFSGLEQVLQETLATLDRSKGQIFEIVESARQETNRLKKELLEVQRATAQVINEVDELRRRDRSARLRLLEASRDFERYTRDDQRIAYEAAEEIRVELAQKLEREQQLRKRRDDLEISLKNLGITVEKGEALVSYVGAASNLLKGSLEEMTVQIEGLQLRQQMGVKVIMAQEEERKRVAREIHDGPAQSMANVVLRAEFCEKMLDQDLVKARQELRELKDVVRGCLADVRRIIFDLRPMTLDDLGLIPTVRRYVGDFKDKHGLEIDLVILGKERRLNPTIEVALFRTVQEALNNIKKHASARSVEVKIDVAPRQVVIAVKDDGRGFNLDKVLADKTRNSLGLISMRERIELVQGQFNVETAPGQGTRLDIVVPIQD